MSITPKDWKSFQHYKDRAPAWIKLHRGLLDDFAFNRLPLASRALAPMLWLLASEYDNGVITASIDEMAFRFRISPGDLGDALKPLIASGFFVECAPLAARQHDAGLEEEKETEERREDSPPDGGRASAPSRLNDCFNEFWQAYPRRDGPNPRAPAEQKFVALVKAGVDPAMLIAAVKKLAADEAVKGNIGSRFIPQALTWLSQQRWADHAAVAAKAPAQPDMKIEDAVKMFARTRHWSRYAGPAPGLAGCRAPPELFAAHGLAPDGSPLPRAEERPFAADAAPRPPPAAPARDASSPHDSPLTESPA
jgi:hypothetical protein